MSSESSASVGSGGVGVGFILFVVFLILKLTHTIDWSWWYVSLPLWGPVALVLALCILIGVPFLIVCAWMAWQGRQ